MYTKTLFNRSILCAALVFLCLYGGQTVQADSTKAPAYLSGYDVVSYFTKQKAEQGKPEYAYQYKGKTYWFSGESHKDMFMKNPERYLPEYDGYCAYGVVHGQKVEASPEAWIIVDNKLYLHTDRSFLEKWKNDTSDSIKKGDEQWSLMNAE